MNNTIYRLFFVSIFFTILNCFPIFVKADLNQALKKVGTYSKTTGPNCWNYALYSAGLVNSLRNVEENEFTFFIKSRLCHKLQDQDAIKPGQIGAIQDIENNKVIQNHAFVFLGPEAVLTKNGPYVAAAYQVMSLKNLLQIPSYQLHPKRLLERYECEDIESFIKNYPGLNIHLLQIYDLVKAFEYHYEQDTLQNIQLDMKFKDTTLLLIEKAILDMAFDGLNSDDHFFRDLIAIHLSGISGQIYYTYASPIMDQFESLSRKLKAL